MVLQEAEVRRGSPAHSLAAGTEDDEPSRKEMKQADKPPYGVDHAESRKVMGQKNLVSHTEGSLPGGAEVEEMIAMIVSERSTRQVAAPGNRLHAPVFKLAIWRGHV